MKTAHVRITHRRGRSRLYDNRQSDRRIGLVLRITETTCFQ